jgi:hypothetical protein
MTLIYDFYGIGGQSIDVVRDTLTDLLHIQFVGRHSEFWGGDYYDFRTSGSEHIRIISNGPEEDPDDLPYDGFDEFPIIVEVNESPYADEYREKLIAAGFEHLRRSTLTDD